jgi:hypothetical protein
MAESIADDDNIIWGEVSEHALRERAFREKVKAAFDKAALFEHYCNR